VRFILGLLLSCILIQAHAEEINVAAASNLRYVLPVLADEFEKNTGHHLALSFAASGTLTTQLLHDAPFEAFLSANPDYMARLIKAGRTEGNLINFGYAQLAMYAAKHSKMQLDSDLEFLTKSINSGHLNKVVIANPKHAPYGQAAKVVLKNAGLWEKIQPHLLIAENASQAVQFTMSSRVDVGFVPYAHVIQPKLIAKGKFVKFDARLPQQAVLIKGAGEAAKQFVNFLQTNAAHHILSEHGFIIEIKE
jgi:molybdate transport system substrate-binding protein